MEATGVVWMCCLRRPEVCCRHPAGRRRIASDNCLLASAATIEVRKARSTSGLEVCGVVAGRRTTHKPRRSRAYANDALTFSSSSAS